MNQLMTPAEFAGRTVGIPWRKWHSSFEACDCYGLVLLYLKHVSGVDLGEVPHTDIIDGFDRSTDWEQCDAEAGAVGWMAFRDDAPTHCGVLLGPGRVLHAEGGESHPGTVRVARLLAIRQVYGPIKFFRRAAC